MLVGNEARAPVNVTMIISRNRRWLSVFLDHANASNWANSRILSPTLIDTMFQTTAIGRSIAMAAIPAATRSPCADDVWNRCSAEVVIRFFYSHTETAKTNTPLLTGEYEDRLNKFTLHFYLPAE